MEFNGTIDPDTGYPEAWITDEPARTDDICVTAHTLYDYGFDNFAGFPNHRDVGIAILDTPVNLSEYGQLPSVGLVDTLGKKAPITSSGYGVTDWDPALVSFRERLMADSYIVNLHNNITSGFGIQSTANPAQGKGGTCNGDSGGPVFQQGTSIILAVVERLRNLRAELLQSGLQHRGLLLIADAGGGGESPRRLHSAWGLRDQVLH